MSVTKQQFRDRFRALRENHPPQEKSTADQQISVHARTFLERYPSANVFIYVSTDDEATTRALIDWMVNKNYTVAVPKIVSANQMVAATFRGWAHMTPGPLGIPAPNVTDREPLEAHLAIVPGLAFSDAGIRLGYGAGYYDRWFADHPDIIKVGLCYAYQVVAELPAYPHDVAMDYLITEQGLTSCRSV